MVDRPIAANRKDGRGAMPGAPLQATVPSHKPPEQPRRGGVSAHLIARFLDPASLLGAARTLRGLGMEDQDLHAPYPLDGASEALRLPASPMPFAPYGPSR